MSMTTEETSALMDRLYAALAAGDRDELLQLFTEDVAWQQPISVPNWHCVGRESVVDRLGHDVVKQLFKSGTFRLKVRRVVIDGNVAIAQQASSAVTHDGQNYEMEYCWVYTWRDGQIAHIQEYLDTYVASKIFHWDAGEAAP